MFGYVKAMPKELKVKEYDFYKSVYCGLCGCMGKTLGCASRVTLSYDFVFLALVRIAVGHDELHFLKKRCFLKKCPSAVLCPCESLEYCARAGALLTYCKIYDDCEDEKGIKRLVKRTELLFAEKMRRRAGLPELFASVKNNMSRLSVLEKSNDFRLEPAADVFGELLSDVASYGVEDKANFRVLKEFGYHIGRWIYTADAADDYYRDIKSNGKNPLISEFGASMSDADAERLRTAMALELCEAEKALALISFSDDGIENIVKNILYFGMPDVAAQVCRTDRERKDSKK